MKQIQTKTLRTVITVLLIVAAFLVGYQMNGRHAHGVTPLWAAMLPTQGNTLDSSTSLRPVQLFQEALTDLQAEYVDPVSNADDLSYAAVRGMLTKMNDPYTRFMDPKEYRDFLQENEGHFAGIGATLKMTELPAVKTASGAVPKDPITCPVCGTVITDVKAFRVTIVEPLPGTPAKAAGLQPGDYITKIDHVSTQGMTISEAADKIRGEEGSKVALTIERDGVEKPIDVTITRAEIQVPAVQSKMLDGHIGYLRLMSFNEKTVEETRAALMDFNKAHVQGVVLDLRSNPGGLLTECIKVASMLLPSDDKVIVTTKGRSRQPYHETRVGDQIYDKPLVVLVNKGSASASEILTGALKDYHRATVLGETTFGKALVQTVLTLGDPANPCAMPVTTAHYYTPSDYDLNKRGIAPDIAVTLDKDTKALSEKDNQALAGLKVLKEEMAKAGN